MTDKEILAAIYNNVGLPKYMKDFIEEEWQKRDELDQFVEQTYNANVNEESKGHFSDSWYKNSDPVLEMDYSKVKDPSRHRELEIGEDGTIKNLK